MRDFADYQRLHTLHDSARSLVLRVSDRQSGHTRVLKIARDDSPGDTPRSQHIQAEFARLQALHHPLIIQVHDLVQTPLGLGYTMDDIDGSALAGVRGTIHACRRESCTVGVVGSDGVWIVSWCSPGVSARRVAE